MADPPWDGILRQWDGILPQWTNEMVSGKGEVGNVPSPKYLSVPMTFFVVVWVFVGIGGP